MADAGAVHEERTIPGYGGAEIVVSIYRRPGQETAGPGIYHIHGGGMIIGNRFMGVQEFLPYISSHGAVIVSVEYRLAPEFPDPVPVEDSYAGLAWTAANAAELGIDPGRIVVAGASAGGGLSAGVTLLARDRQGPALLASLLIYPMLDDRNESISSHQIQGIGVWDRTSNFTGWDALLGNRRGTDDVSIYASPARATDLSGLPPTFIDVGTAEVFRDEDVAYASLIWASGGNAELHAWPGGFHGFDNFAPQAELSMAMVDSRHRWLRRMLQAYFDKLVDGRVGSDGMLRGAAVLCGAPMGHRGIEQDQGPRFAADGTALPPGPSRGWPSAASGDGEIVWLERQGTAQANDAMVLERLAIALSIATMRLDTLAPTRRAIEVLLSGDSSAEERTSAAARLSLGNHSVTYAIAVPASERLTTSVAHAMVATPHGIVRAVLAPGQSPPALRAGIGVAARSPDELQGSWRAALVALRLADDDHPVVRASDLGVLLALADAADTSSHIHPDVALLGGVVEGPWTAGMLRALADGASQRALAAAAGVHHSTMGIRLQKLPGLLGYDPLTPAGRTRLDVTLMLHKLATVRFDGGQ